MLGRLWKSFRIAAAALIAAVPALAVPPPQPPRVIAVGDLHGDFQVWRDIAQAAGMVDAHGGWSGGRATLVQVGDVVDREPESLKIVRDLMRLQKEAARQGGRVIVLVGNHEAMNMTGDLRYVVPGDFAAFATRHSAELRERLFEAKAATIEAQYRQKNPKMTSAAVRDAWIKATPLGWVEQRLAWNPKGEIGRWVVSNPAVALVGDSLFVHGGISAETAKTPLRDVNAQVAAALTAMDKSPDSIINSPLGPLWYRGHLTRDPGVTEIPAKAIRPPIEDELSRVLKAYGAKRIVVGHTPNLRGIQLLQGGKLVAIDTGNSRYYGGTPSYLEIIGERVTPHAVARSSGRGGGGGE